MRIFATFDAAGLLSGSWPQDGLGPSPPDGAVEITKAQWHELFDYPGARRWDGEAVVVYAPPPQPPAPRTALGSALRDALKATGQSAAWQVALGGQSQDTRDWWAARYDRDIAITATKLVRIARACNPQVDLAKLYDAAPT